MQNKRGLSAIIATLIIILLVLVAAGIIWVVIRNVIKQGAEDIDLGTFMFDLSIKSAYIDGSDVKVGVRRSPGGEDLIGVKFIFFDGTDSINVERKTPLLELQEKIFTFNSSEVGDVGSLQEVSIAPIYELDSGNEKTGGITDTATISGSAPPGGNGGGEDPECDDEIDNDGDGDIDLSDAGCADSSDDDETNCGDDVCEGGEDVGSCPSDCSGEIPSSCDGSWSPPEDPEVECDGGANCGVDCICLTGFTADGAGGCDLDSPINSGTIFSVWPSGAVKYFDSEDLPMDLTDYTSYYVNFSGSAEDGCFRITWAEYMETNGRSYIRTEFIVDITPSEGYDVWEAVNCGV